MATLEFDPLDPFPLVFDVEYADEKNHAVRVDAWLGFRTELIEEMVEKSAVTPTPDTSREFWIGKSVQTFSTPYTELRAMLEDVKPKAGETVVDLGAGYGRMAHVIARHFKDVRFLGFEFVVDRQIEGLRAIKNAGLENSSLIQADVTTLDFGREANAAYYFLYDFGSRRDVEITVENLKKAAAVQPITVIGRGGRSRDIIEKYHPWLSQVVTPLHRRHYSIYRSAESRSE